MAQAIELLKFCDKIFKSMSEVGIRIGDYRYVNMYDEYKDMEKKGMKKEYIRAVLAERHGMSERTVFRVISRLERRVKI